MDEELHIKTLGLDELRKLTGIDYSEKEGRRVIESLKRFAILALRVYEQQFYESRKLNSDGNGNTGKF